MSQIIQIQDINSSDTIKTMVEKINYNFDQIMTFGGGPQGEKGDKGELGPDGEQGEQGERGNLITVVDNISTVGSDLKVGDIAIYSDDQYIYEVKENSDNNLFFEKTSIYIKGNKGESGTSDSPFKYDEIQDAIITEKIPSHTFIGTNTVISNGVGALNIVGNENANGIYLFTKNSDSNYCGKIYGDKLGSENILVLQGEDGDNNYVKIDDTLLTDKIHSSNNIKIAEVIDDRIVLGDRSKNASIECNEFAVKNGNNITIKTSSSKINLEGNLYVNDNNYTYTTKICGSSVDINSDSIYVSLPRMSSRPIQFVSSQANIYARKNNISASVINGLIQSSIEIDSEKIKIDTDKVIIGKNSQSNTQINGDVTAKVNGVPDVYLGCPIGTVVMWSNNTAPEGWFLCNGDQINFDFSPTGAHSVEQTIQGKHFEYDELNVLGRVIGALYGSYGQLPNLQQKFPIGYNNLSKYQQIKKVFDCYNDWRYLLTRLIDISGVFGIIPLLEGAAIRNEQLKLVRRLSNFYNFTMSNIPTDIRNEKQYNAFIHEINRKTLFDLGSTNGELMHTLTEEEMPTHSHEMRSFKTNTSTTGGRIVALNANKGDSLKSETMSESTDTENKGKSHPHNNIPPYLAINFIIKYK